MGPGRPFLLAAVLGALLATPAVAADQGVSVEDNMFVQSKVAVKPGESVTWTATGNNTHSVTLKRR